jgi:hypothetical protein
VLAGIHLAQAQGAFGTGSGKLGAIVALLLAAIGVVFGIIILSRNNKNSNKYKKTAGRTANAGGKV